MTSNAIHREAGLVKGGSCEKTNHNISTSSSYENKRATDTAG